MKRFALYKGVPGKLVHDPRTNARRFAGMKRCNPAPEQWAAQADLYEPCEVVLPCSQFIDKAVEAGELELITGPVVAADMADAKKQLQAPKRFTPTKFGAD